MSKALLGAHADPRTLQLLDEVRALRARVAELEAALEEAERAASTREDLDVVVTIGDAPRTDREPAGT